MIDKRLLSLLGNNKKYIFYIIAIQIFIFLTSISTTSLICYLIYTISNENNMFFYGFLAVMLFLIIKFILTNLLTRVINKLSSLVLIKTRIEFYDNILENGLDNKNEAMQLAIEGLEQLNLYYTVYIPQFFYAMIAPIILFTIFCFIDYRSALIYLFALPLIPVSIILISKYAKKVFNKYWDRYIEMGGSFLDAISGMKELKLFKKDLYMQNQLDTNNEQFRKITMKVLIMQLFSTTIMDLVAYGGSAIAIIVSILNFKNGVSVDNLYLVLFLILAGSEFFLPLRSLGSSFHLAMNGATAGNRLLDIIDKNQRNRNENPKMEISQIETIRFKNADFKYSDSNEYIFKNLNLDINQNELIAIIGKSGSGKSTIAKLFVKQNYLTSGKLLINDIHIDEIAKSSLFHRLAFVSYENHIFNDTLFNNFKMARKEITKEEIYEALKKVKLEYLIDEHGYDYRIKEDASNLSGGEKQRLSLAINLVNPKDLYIFDEATSNIDKESEEIILDNIYQLKKKSIVIIISHTLKNLINSDKIVFLDENDILIGTNDELYAKSANYKHLLNIQTN